MNMTNMNDALNYLMSAYPQADVDAVDCDKPFAVANEWVTLEDGTVEHVDLERVYIREDMTDVAGHEDDHCWEEAAACERFYMEHKARIDRIQGVVMNSLLVEYTETWYKDGVNNKPTSCDVIGFDDQDNIILTISVSPNLEVIEALATMEYLDESRRMNPATEARYNLAYKVITDLLAADGYNERFDVDTGNSTFEFWMVRSSWTKTLTLEELVYTTPDADHTFQDDFDAEMDDLCDRTNDDAYDGSWDNAFDAEC